MKVIVTGNQPIRFQNFLKMICEIVGQAVQIDLQSRMDSEMPGHYSRTPYTFYPKTGKKLVSHYYLNMGQGLPDCLQEIISQIRAKYDR